MKFKTFYVAFNMIMFFFLLIYSLWVIYPVLEASIVLGDLPTKKVLASVLMFIFALVCRDSALKAMATKD